MFSFKKKSEIPGMFKRIILLLILFVGFNVLAQAQPLDKVVALVNDDVITASELETQVDLAKKKIQAKQMQMPEDSVLRKQVLQHLIDVALQLQLAKNNGITVDSTELNDSITKIATTNNLSVTQLREAVGQQGMTWKEYRENIRKEMIIGRLQQKAVGKEVMVSNEQVDDYLKTAKHTEKAQGTFTLQNIVIPLPEAPTTEQLNKAKDKAQALLEKLKKGADFNRMAIEESSGEFALEGGDLGARHLAELPDLFAKEVVNMQVGQVVGPLRAGNGFQLIKLMAKAEDPNQKHEVTQTHVRHILIKADASTTPQEAVRQAQNIYQQIKAGKDFALMAKQYSVDSASAIKGGDLNWVSPGELVPAFEKTMDKLPLNTVSKPVKTAFGWHIIEVLGRKKIDDSITFKKMQVRQFLQQRKFTEAVQNWQQHIRTDAYVSVLEKDLA
jgi:peptidyl-prolyl cis-trans isomerase SurA